MAGDLDESFAQIEQAKEELRRREEEYEERKDAYIAAICNGETTGDPIKDFCIVNRRFGDKEKEGELRAWDKKLQSAQGKPVLIETTHRYSYGLTHGSLSEGRFPGKIVFRRLGIPTGEREWMRQGITLPMEHYAFEIENNHSIETLWTPHHTPLQLGIAELIDQIYFSAHEHARLTTEENAERKKYLRTDLPDAFWNAYKSHELRRDNGTNMMILVGDEAAATLAGSTRRFTDGLYKDCDNAGEAIFCATYGITREEMEQKQQKALNKKRERLMKRIETVYGKPGQRKQLEALLHIAVQLGMHTTEETYLGKMPGSRIDGKRAITALCNEYAISYAPQVKP